MDIDALRMNLANYDFLTSTKTSLLVFGLICPALHWSLSPVRNRGWGRGCVMADFFISSLHPCRKVSHSLCLCEVFPVHSTMLTVHLFSGLPLLRLPPTVSCSITLVSPSDIVTCSYHFSCRRFTVARIISYGPICFRMVSRTCSLVIRSL